MLNIAGPIISERITLDLIKGEDHAFVLVLLNSPGWIQFIGDRNIHSNEAALAYIEKIRSTPDLFYWVAKIKDTQQPIGIFSFLKRSYLPNFDLGFALLPEFQHKGFAFEGAQSVLHFVIKQFPSEPILATLLPDNISSIKLLLKLGFVLDKTVEVANETLHIYKYINNG